MADPAGVEYDFGPHRPIVGTDANPAPDLHDDGCNSWCNHCSLCGYPIVYGARCEQHLGMHPKQASGNRQEES